MRDANFAVDDEELAKGLYSIAAPVRDEGRDVVAAVDIAVPSSMISLGELVDALGPHLDLHRRPHLRAPRLPPRRRAELSAPRRAPRGGGGAALRRARRVLSAAGMPSSLKRASLQLCAVLLVIGLSACATTVSTSGYKGEAKDVAQTIKNLQSDVTAGEQKKVCDNDLAAPVVKSLSSAPGGCRAGDQRPAQRDRVLRSERPVDPDHQRRARGHREGQEQVLRQEQGLHDPARQGRRQVEDRQVQLS